MWIAESILEFEVWFLGFWKLGFGILRFDILSPV
jgi:hypothetical protein